MKRVCKGEKKSIDTDVLSLIAEHADFAFRDAHKILDELLSAKDFSLEAVKKQLGLSLMDVDLLSLIDKKSVKLTLDAIEKYELSGGNFTMLIESLLKILHLLLLKKNDIVREGSQNLDYSFTLPQIILLMKLFHTAYKELKITPIDAIPLEIAVVEYFAGIE